MLNILLAANVTGLSAFCRGYEFAEKRLEIATGKRRDKKLLCPKNF